MLIDIAAEDAIALAPYLKAVQLEALSSRDEFTTILPNFEVYHMQLSHGRDPSQVTTDVIGIKCEPRDAKLLNEFFTHMASENNSYHRDGTFVPKGAAYLLGPQTYEQVLKDNNLFLSNVATIPINLEYDAWFAVINPHASSDTTTILLYNHLICKPWFLRIESVGRNKCLLVTTRHNLPAARDWINENLKPMVHQSIPLDLNPPAGLLPCHLDKPTYTAASQSYADILKKQFSIASTTSATTTDITRPPCKRQATKLDYDSDTPDDRPQSMTITASSTNGATSTQQTNSQPTPTTTNTTTYAAELWSLKAKIDSLKAVIAMAVEQFKSAVNSLTANPPQPAPYAMETDAETTSADTNPNQIHTEIPSLNHDLKHEIATFVIETRALLRQPSPPMIQNIHLPSKT